ncbi:MAG: DUF1566 domain-containing protein [Candidatus Electrothrix sp. LOE2]|nr:DUF1566 domain-containing protein [Candidatus Electrothrix sp. LOE2]
MTTPDRKTKTPPEGELAQVLAVLEANTTLLAFLFGLCFVAALLVLAIWFPNPTAFQYTVFRITLALAAAGIAGVIPGMIRLTVHPGTALMIHAGGALAVFVMVYLLAPAKLPTEQPALSSLPPIKKEKSVVPKAPPSVSSNTTDAGKEMSSPPPTKKEKPAVLNAIKIGRFLDNRDGTITDTRTGLMWKRCSEGLSGENCEEGQAEEYNWDDAVQGFKNVEYAGYADWRLPTIDELKTLVSCSNGVKDKENGECNDGSENPTINRQAFPNTTSWYWSGSPSAGYSDYAWYVGFNGGNSSSGVRDVNFAVRLVRGGQ